MEVDASTKQENIVEGRRFFPVKQCGRSERQVVLHCFDFRHTAAINKYAFSPLLLSSSSFVFFLFVVSGVVSFFRLSGSRVVCTLMTVSLPFIPVCRPSLLPLIRLFVFAGGTVFIANAYRSTHTTQHTAHTQSNTPLKGSPKSSFHVLSVCPIAPVVPRGFALCKQEGMGDVFQGAPPLLVRFRCVQRLLLLLVA